jgi:ParB-like chromosome segregation protein Spo0J
VQCEIRQLDDFEASLECYKRNRGGKDNPVVLGRMFREMMKAKNLSIRALAKELGISEAKVRIYLDYLAAYEVRIEYAPASAEDDIARLTQARMRKYISMPSAVGDRWLDAGADPSVFEGLGTWTPDRVPCEINRFKLSAYLDTSPTRFDASVSQLARLAMWLDPNKHIKDVRAYAAAVAKLGMTADVMDSLPIGTTGEHSEVMITPEAWDNLLAQAKEKASKRSGLLAEIEAGVRLALRETGIDPADVCSPADAEALRIVENSPKFIQQADHLTLSEKRWLAEIPEPEGDDITSIAKEQVCQLLHEVRSGKKSKNMPSLLDSPAAYFQFCFAIIERQRQNAAIDELFADGDALAAKLIEKLSQTAAIRDGLVGEQGALECLTQRLSGVELPEWHLIASLVIQPGAIEEAATRWLQGFENADVAEDAA